MSTGTPGRAGTPRHVLVLVGYAPSLLNFRGPLLATLVARGHRVTAAAPDLDDGLRAALTAMGVRPVEVPLQRAGRHPLRDLGAFVVLVGLLRRERPDVLLAYTIKPVLYGTLAAWIARVPTRVANVTGLGFAFGEAAGVVGVAVRWAYRLAMRAATLVVFQNPDDQAHFVRERLVRAERTLRVHGSGVDLERFPPVPLPNGPPTFLLIARLLRDKGIGEYVAAARRVRETRPDARFVLVGPHDPNPMAIDPRAVEAWVQKCVIEYAGATDDVRPFLNACHVYVLPSYREGTPRTVLEAMATGRAIITTDAPGCRETVQPGRNGLLVPVGDAEALADAMLELLADPARVAAMGRASLEIARERYDVHRVNDVLIEAIGL